MSNSRKEWWLATVAICCLAPAAFADGGYLNHRTPEPRRNRDFCQVPEGGSTAIYLLATGLTCLGAMFLRSKAAKPTQS